MKFQYRNGEEADLYTILESLGGGVGLLDYDQDGRLDIFLPGGGYFDVQGQQVKGYPNRLYHNEGGGRFRDVTAEAGLDGPLFYSHGCAVGDYDNDGWPDLLVTGYGRVALFHNHHGKFEDVTEKAGLAGSRGPQWSTSAAWADLNGDGLPDLFVCQYVDWSLPRNVTCRPLGPGSEVDVCSPTVYEPLPQIIYFNQGNGTFREAGPEAGLKKGKGLGVVVADVDEDGRPDIYVANDTTDNFLYVNRSTRGRLRFEDRALELGVARDDQGAPNGSMGVDAGDYDGSGNASLLVTNYQNELHALYRNVGRPDGPSFVFNSRAAGLA
ncbi:MAG: VCBS repeat-containing protein, partial [Planctomycetes bacterium]|nr:VCBS repeat-containing protein [Planctomycetota bacterium]